MKGEVGVWNGAIGENRIRWISYSDVYLDGESHMHWIFKGDNVKQEHFLPFIPEVRNDKCFTKMLNLFYQNPLDY